MAEPEQGEILQDLIADGTGTDDKHLRTPHSFEVEPVDQLQDGVAVLLKIQKLVLFQSGVSHDEKVWSGVACRKSVPAGCPE